MIVVAIVGIFAAIGIPSMTDFVRNTRLNSARTQLTNDLNFARSEAVKRNIRVLVCAANSANTDCSAVTDWASNGWLVCYDGNADGACDATSSANPNPIQIRASVHSTLTITGPATPVRFNPIGSQGVIGNLGVSLTISGSWSGAVARTVAIANTGSITNN
jgi:type IV fimbrial biogenesis protein FimT